MRSLFVSVMAFDVHHFSFYVVALSHKIIKSFNFYILCNLENFFNTRFLFVSVMALSVHCFCLHMVALSHKIVKAFNFHLLNNLDNFLHFLELLLISIRRFRWSVLIKSLT